MTMLALWGLPLGQVFQASAWHRPCTSQCVSRQCLLTPWREKGAADGLKVWTRRSCLVIQGQKMPGEWSSQVRKAV